MRLLDPKVDIIFKELFGTPKESKQLLTDFINDLLELKGEEQIEIEEFLDTRKHPVAHEKPASFIDVLVKAKSGERCIIEMQTYSHEGFAHRLHYYLAKDYVEQIDYITKSYKRLIGWKHLPKIHVIAITSFSILPDERDYKEIYQFSPQRNRKNAALFDRWRMTVLDLSKFKGKEIESLSTSDGWAYFLKNVDKLSEEQIAEMAKKLGHLKTPIAHLKKISLNPKMRQEYEMRMNSMRDETAVHQKQFKEGKEKGRKEGEEKGRKEGEEKGRKEGEEKGRKKEKFTLAKKLLQKGMLLEEVAAMTDLPIEDIHILEKAEV